MGAKNSNCSSSVDSSRWALRKSPIQAGTCAFPRETTCQGSSQSRRIKELLVERDQRDLEKGPMLCKCCALFSTFRNPVDFKSTEPHGHRLQLFNPSPLVMYGFQGVDVGPKMPTSPCQILKAKLVSPQIRRKNPPPSRAVHKILRLFRLTILVFKSLKYTRIEAMCPCFSTEYFCFCKHCFGIKAQRGNTTEASPSRFPSSIYKQVLLLSE